METPNIEVMKKILDKIKEYDKIVISRHIRPDGDCVGSTKGLCEILRISFPEKKIYLINEDYSDYLAFLGGEDGPIPDGDYKDALVMILDTANTDRISNKKYSLGKELIKIDHHIEISPFGDISWVEDYRSSVCEMIAVFYLQFSDELKINSYAATCIYTGMVTDSGRFRYESSSGETLRCAAAMLDAGIDTETLFAHLYLEDFNYFKFQAYVFGKMKITEHGVAYLTVDRNMQEKFGLTHEQASNAVSFMSSIRGSIIWIAFIENPDATFRVRLRSRFVAVNKLAEKYGGGGHANASGAACADKKELRALIKDADRLIKEYKESNEGWL